MQFKQTDEEIDQMLDVILDQLDRLKLQAQDIGKEIATQKVLIKKVNNHVGRARDGLVKQ